MDDKPDSSSLPSLPSIKTSPGIHALSETTARLKHVSVTSSDFRKRTINPHSVSPPKFSATFLPQNLSDSSVYNSPTNISPSSSAFVSANQSPFLSPRLQLPSTSSCQSSNPSTLPQLPSLESPFVSPCSSGILQSPDADTEQQQNQKPQRSPLSYPASLSDDIPSSSYTPPTEDISIHDIHLVNFSCEDFSDDAQRSRNQPANTDHAPPRVSFSFPAPRVSFAKGSASPPPSTRLRSCDVYIGIHGQSPSLLRFSKWLCSELELQGMACFSADRSTYSDTQSHDIADRIISSATFGVLIITKLTFLNPFGIDEIRIFLQRKNLVPIFFDISQSDCVVKDIVEKRGKVWEKNGGQLWRLSGDQEEEWRDAIEGLAKLQEWKLEATNGNWRGCILKTVSLLGAKLGRKSVGERERVKKERAEENEFPFLRNAHFVGREKELSEIESILFGKKSDDEAEDVKLGFYGRFEKDRRRRGSKKGLCFMEGCVEGMNKEAEVLRHRKRGLLETKSQREPHLEAWIEPKQANSRSKQGYGFALNDQCNKSEPPNSVSGSGIACISGVSGIGKTELALEFAYRFSQRYRMVLWVGGEARYLRHNFLNLSSLLGLDIGTLDDFCPLFRIKTFEEQEYEAIQMVRRELLRDIPYLLIIDNLECEMDWWDGRDILELLPRMNAATHVIITTKLPRLKNLKPLELMSLPRADSLLLMKGKRDFSPEDTEALRIIEENLGRLTFGLGIVSRVLSELSITPTALLEAINKAPLRELTWNVKDDPVLKNNPFLVQLLGVVFSIISHSSRPSNLASRMAWVGGWFAPSAIPASLLAFAARRVSNKGSSLCVPKKCFRLLCCCYMASQTKKWEADGVALLLKFGIAKKACKQGWIHFHEIVQLYSQKKGGASAAKAMVQAIKKKGALPFHMEHYWAACFLLFGFANDPVVVEPKVSDLISFIKKDALSLAVRGFTLFSRCNASLELLRLCTNALEEVEKTFVSQIGDWCDKSLCWKRGSRSSYVDEYVWQDVTLLKALLLENRARLLLRGGQFDASEELCRTCISIRTVMLGHDHPQTLMAQETLAKIVRHRSKI